MGRGRRVEHSFYCMKCGRKGIPLARKEGHQHKSFHRKKLYCVFCKEEVNHIECKNYEEIERFKEDFKCGVYENEAKESISYVRAEREWKNDLGKNSNS
jgi:hypothetical protein